MSVLSLAKRADKLPRMKITFIALTIASVLSISTSAADINNAGFLAVGSSYTLQFAEGGRLARFDYRHPVKITAAAPGGWYRVEYFAMPENYRAVPQPNEAARKEAAAKAPPSEKKERWLNFAYVVSAVEATPTPETKPQ